MKWQTKYGFKETVSEVLNLTFRSIFAVQAVIPTTVLLHFRVDKLRKQGFAHLDIVYSESSASIDRFKIIDY